MEKIWGMDNDTEDRTVDVHIKRLREKFEETPEFSIVTVRGLGYKLVKNV
jgi:DNA-binding response OmpR family regulator